jgi:hypothetical protein
MRIGRLVARVFRLANFDCKRIPPVSWIVAIGSGAGLLICAFRWPLVRTLTVLIEPLLELAVFGSFAGSVVWAAIYALFPLRGSRPYRFGPLLPGLAALAVFIYFPFTKTYLKNDRRVRGTSAVPTGLLTYGIRFPHAEARG